MGRTTFTRQTDDLGRVTIPLDLRQSLNIHKNELLDFAIEDERLIITKHYPVCQLCGSMSELIEIDRQHVCRDCAQKLTTQILVLQK